MLRKRCSGSADIRIAIGLLLRLWLRGVSIRRNDIHPFGNIRFQRLKYGSGRGVSLLQNIQLATSVQCSE